uniref:Alpha/beta hydrolase n=1 Tax=Paulinella longichromatophora TaxID=1708747 RepID=A0A2H4ZNN2_9EUKA|nr:hypothetical protein PLO_113 [Paulinella longichromatophora]
MTTWRQRGNLWSITPDRPIGVIEFIGGSYLAATSQLTYRLLLEELVSAGFIIRAWSYLPTFDHQTQARSALYCFSHEQKRSGSYQNQTNQLFIRLGHSLGCKLHLLAPDGGCNTNALVALSFNNFSVSQSIPFLKILSTQLGLITEFSPCPNETFRLISKYYKTPSNLLVQFTNDQIDQSYELLKVLESRSNDSSEILLQEGNHLTPANMGGMGEMLGVWSNQNMTVTPDVHRLAQNIVNWLESNATLTNSQSIYD